MCVGEALSKKELKSNQLIKKLKLKETELEKTNQDLTKKLDLTSAELLGLKEQLGKMADLEKRHKGTNCVMKMGTLYSAHI